MDKVGVYNISCGEKHWRVEGAHSVFDAFVLLSESDNDFRTNFNMITQRYKGSKVKVQAASS